MAESTSLEWIVDILDEFGISKDDTTTVSSLGYATRVMADYMDQIDYRTIDDKKEKFLSTATKMSSLYKHARKEGIEPDKASSSTVPVYMYVFLDDIAAADVVDSTNNKKKITISVDTVFKLGSVYKLKLDYPIDVYSTGTSDIKYFAKYDNTTTNPISDISTTTIPVRKYVHNNKECLLLSVNLRDYEIQTAELGYVGPSATAVFNVSYTNYIQYIECKYKDPDVDTYRTIDTAMFFDKAISSETIFYVIKDSVVAFANKYKSGRFDPIAGGRFKFNIYTTTCSTFSEYIGDTSLILSDDAEYSLDFSVAGGATGGAKPMDKETLRAFIKNYNSTNGSLISSTDVANYLATYGSEDTVYSSFKYVDSFNDRIYNIVMRLGPAKNMMPTNTTDLRVHEDYSKRFESGRFLTFDTDQEFVGIRDSGGNTFVISKSQFLNDPTYSSYDKTSYISYALPYQVCYDRKYNLVYVFEKSVNRDIALLYSYVEEAAYTYICTGLNYKYLLDYDDPKEYYEFNYNLTPSNSDMYAKIHSMTTDSNGNSQLNDLGYMKSVILFYKDSALVGYMPAEISSYDSSAKVYGMTAFLRMNSPIYADNLDVTIYNTNHEIVDVTFNLNKLTTSMVVYRYNSGYTDTTGQAKYPIFPDYSIVNVFETMDDGTSDTMIFKEISKFLPTQINDKTTALNGNTTENPYGIIKEVVLDKLPFVSYTYYEVNQEDVSSAINNELVLLDKINSKIEGAFKSRFNLVNTYGYSNRLMIGLNPRSIGTTHINMEVNVRKVSTSVLTDTEIATYINTYFSKIDFKNGESFHFSKLSEATKETYTDIEFMELKSVNGFTTDNQYIYMKDYDSVLFIPEVASIAKDDNDNFKIAIINV